MAPHGSPRTVLGRYVVLRKVGSGGMGDVFEARDSVTEQRVALKSVALESVSEEGRVRLQREAEALRRFEHPNIVGFHAMEASEGRFYCVMEFVEGESLAARIERDCRIDGLFVDVAILERVARQVASALAHAHGHGVLHRDVKPDNILVAADGRPVLTDFGLAKVKDLFSVTSAGQAMGTVAYFAPEQMRGEAADERTDVYQYGLTLYETATGRLPFAAEVPLMAMKRRISEPIPPPSTLNPASPSWLDGVILRCLEPDPARRFPSFAEILGVIEAVDRAPAAPPPAPVPAAAAPVPTGSGRTAASGRVPIPGVGGFAASGQYRVVRPVTATPPASVPPVAVALAVGLVFLALLVYLLLS